MRFPSDEELQSHREYQHGEFIQNDYLRDIKVKDNTQRVPPKNQWIIQLSDTKSWLWNPWRKEYFMYILGVGCISNELYPDKYFICEDKQRQENERKRMKEMIICDEDSNYFKEWRDILTNSKPLKGEPTPRPKMYPMKPEMK